MNNIIFIIEKEFKQIFRNKGMLPIIFALPIIQLFLLANAATFDIKNLKIGINDRDNSTFSRELVRKIEGSNYFIITSLPESIKKAEIDLDYGKIDIYLEIPDNFENKIIRLENPTDNSIFMIFNAIDGTKAGLGMNYLSSIINDFSRELITKSKIKIVPNEAAFAQKNISIEYSNWFNPELNYHTFMLPGILVLLVTMIGTFLSSMNVVREKEIGTIDQINVTPIKKYEFIIGKLTPLLIIGLFELMFGMLFSRIAYNVPLEGSGILILSFGIIYIIAALGLGLLISTTTDNQQQAMFISWFILVIFILLSGLFTPIESMPAWVKYITYINPVKYFIEVVRLVMLKGSTFNDISNHFVIISIFAILLNGLAIFRYRKTSS